MTLAERLYTHPDTPAETGQHQQQAEPDETHADDLGRRPDADGVGDGDRDCADEQKPCADGDDDQRAAVVGGDHRHRERATAATHPLVSAGVVMEVDDRGDGGQLTSEVAEVATSASAAEFHRQSLFRRLSTSSTRSTSSYSL